MCEYCGQDGARMLETGVLAHQECYDQAGGAPPPAKCRICGEYTGGAIACPGCWDEAWDQGLIPTPENL